MKKFMIIFCMLSMLCFAGGCTEKNSVADISAQAPLQQQIVADDQEKSVTDNTVTDNKILLDDSKNDTKDTNLENIKKDNPVKNTQSATTQSTASKADMTKPAADKPDKNAETAILIKGEGVSKEVSITMSQIKAMKDQVAEYTYFSRGKEPKTACNTYKGVKLSYLLGLANVKSTAQKVTIVAADGYTATFSIIDVNAMLMDETDSSKKLPMLIAFAEDGKMLNYGSGYNLRLVVGQKCEGDYNRQYWVSEVSCIIVK